MGRDCLIIDGGKVITPAETFRGGRVVIVGSKIAAIGPKAKIAAPAGARRISARGKLVLPGLIDAHTHGFCGTDCGEGVEAVLNMRRSLPRFGVTGFLPTMICPAGRNLQRQLDDVRAAAKADCGGAQVLGVHLEGPYFNRDFGAFPERHASVPAARAQEQMISRFKGFVKIVTLSPELKGAFGFIRRLRAAGIVAAIGHSGADVDCLTKAADAGAQHVIHLFNAMRRRSREELGCEWPGLSDHALVEDRLTAEVIADGIHVKPTLLKLAVRAKGVDRVVLVTDSMKPAGMPAGIYELRDGLSVVSDGTSCRTRDGGLAGSLLTLNRAVVLMTRLAGVTIEQAVQMATLNPARLIGVQRRKGSLKEGRDADICIADEQMEVQVAIVKGRVVHEL